jgi:hypothetical protein
MSIDKNLEDNGQANETQDFDEIIIYAFGDVNLKVLDIIKNCYTI